MSEEHNRRAWDGKIKLIGTVTVVVSSLWAGVQWLDEYVVTQDEIIKLQYRMDYHDTRIRLDFTNSQVEALEAKLDEGGHTPSESRRYNALIKLRERLKLKVDELAETF